MNVCETVCVISSEASLQEVDHVHVNMDIHVYSCIYMHIYVYTKMMSMCV
jgi:hypothetical protein